MKHIVTFFLCLLFLTECFARSITSQDLPADLLTQITRCDAVLYSVFKLRRTFNPAKKLHIRYGRTLSLKMRSNTLYLVLRPDRHPFQDPRSCQALFSALLLSRGALALNPDAETALPVWICAGLLERFHSYGQAEKYLHGLQYMPVVEAMYTAGLRPDLKRLPELPPPEIPEAWKWYCQYSRLLLEIAVDRKILPHLGKRLLQTADYQKENKDFTAQLFKPVSGSRQPGYLSKKFWNYYHTKPASFKIRQLNEMLQWRMPVLDEEGKPKTETLTCSLTDLHNQLKDRPDAAEQRKAAGERIQKFRAGCTPGELSRLQDLFFLLSNPPQDLQETSQELEQAVERLKNTLQLRQTKEAYLRNTELKNMTLTRTQAGILNITATGDATPEQLHFLLETEKTYGE